MLLQKVTVAMGFVALVSASVMVKRQGTTIPIPDACTSQCTILQTIASSAQTGISQFCTTTTQQDVITCYSCIETNAPGEITPEALTYAQAAMNNVVNACANLGSPIPSISIPGATGTTSINTAGTIDATLSSLLGLTNGGLTAAPSTTGGGGGTGTGSGPTPTSTTSHSGGMNLLQQLPQTLGVGLLMTFTVAMVV